MEEELQHAAGSSRRDRLRQQQVLLVGRDRQGHPELRVNHEPWQVVLAKEVRHLTWLGFRVPAAVKVMADRAGERYPHALALQATLRAWAQTKGAMVRLPEMEALLAGHVQVRTCVYVYMICTRMC